MKRQAIVLFLLACGLATVFCDVPVRKENLVYSILAANGRDFTPTFARQESDTIYLIAKTDNFLSVRKVLLYYWPITGEWKTDTATLDVPMEGNLEVIGPRDKVTSVALDRYTYYNVRGEYELNWKVARGAEADAVLAYWNNLSEAYKKAVREYRDQTVRFEAELNYLVARIQRLRDAGVDVRALVEKMTSLSQYRPKEPSPPREYVVPPANAQYAFILNLPVGTYHIRLRNPDGSIMEGSDKTLVVFESRKAGGIGYEVIPGDKWTRPVESLTPSSVLYVNGSSDLYLQTFFEDEFNDLSYAKTLSNDAKGNGSLMKWMRIQQVPKARIRLTSRGVFREVSEEPFVVEQSKTTTLGYSIRHIDPQEAAKGVRPSILAFAVPRDSAIRRLEVSTLDENGNLLSGSDRQIRVIGQWRGQAPLLLLALFPIVVLAFVLFLRARSYKG